MAFLFGQMKDVDLRPIIISVVLTPFALYASYVSMLGGQGYVLPQILFPYTMLSEPLLGKIYLPFLLLAVVQFPLYGVILAFAGKSKKFGAAVIGLLALHFLTLVLCLIAGDRTFS
jgi:hypothetical protein